MLLYTNVLRQPRLEAVLRAFQVRTKAPLVGNSQILRDAECPLGLRLVASDGEGTQRLAGKGKQNCRIRDPLKNGLIFSN